MVFEKLVDTSAALNAELEVRSTAKFGVVCLKGEEWPEVKEEQKAAAAAAEDDFGDDFGDDDLFGDDDDDAEAAALAEKMAAAAKKKKKAAPKARSMIVLEVKPFDAETDLEALAQGIKKITHEGIQNWGQEHKLQPIAFGIKKLIISLVVFDDLIGTDDITDMLEGKFEDDIQSIDIAAFSKV